MHRVVLPYPARLPPKRGRCLAVPGKEYLRSFNEIGKERGWGPTARAHFDAGASPGGALMVGDPETVAKKIHSYATKLGGISRMTFQMSVASLPHDQALNSIRLIGKEVIPLWEELWRGK